MPLTLEPRAEPLPGYQLLEPLGKGGFGEVWKCEAPGGLVKAVKFVHGGDGGFLDASDVEQELRALEAVRAVRHPFLLSMDRIEVIDGALLVVMELAEGSLADRLRDCQAEGLPGVPRDDLVLYLREAAEVLDLMNFRHGLQHLDIKPHNLLLLGGHVKVADFGLVSRLPGAHGVATQLRAGVVSPMYASPEAFRGTPGPASDQYSLAVAYHELLTGELPFAGANPRLLALQHAQAEPDLHRLPEADRAIVARALSKEPGRRFASCAEFARALALQSGGPAAVASGAGEAADPRLTDTPTGATLHELQLTPAGTGAGPHAVLGNCRFEECLSRTEAAEVWSARTTTGERCFVKFAYGLGALDGAARRDALQLLQAVRHPGLLRYSLVRDDGDRLILVIPRLGPTLRDRLRQCREEGRRGVPRAELLAALRPVARTLDALHGRNGLPHLGLNPEGVQIVAGQGRAADFGLAVWLGLPAGQVLAEANPRYSAPELWTNAVCRFCDSYSLALIFQEMLTGQHPLGAGARPTPRQYAQPDLTPLSAADRVVMARALDRMPGRRFDSCGELIDALEEGVDRPESGAPSAAAAPVAPDDDASPVRQLIADVIAVASDGWQPREHCSFRYLIQPGERLRHHCVTTAARETAPFMLAEFCRRWQAQLTEDRDDVLVMRATRGGEAGGRGPEKPVGLEATLQFLPHATPGLSEVRVQVRPFGCGPSRAAQLLSEAGPALVEGLRAALQAHPERRQQNRLGYDQPVEIDVVLEGASQPARVLARGKNLSRTGVGLLLSARPVSAAIVVHLSPGGDAPSVPVPAHIVRVQAQAEGYEVGARFVVGAE